MSRTQNHLVCKRVLNHLSKFNHLAKWLSYPLQILSFVIEFNGLNTFLKLNPKFNFNIIFSSAFKSHTFIPYKKSCFYKMKSFGKRRLLTKFSLEISQELLQTTLNFSLIFLIWSPIIKIKFMVPIMHSQINFKKSVIILTCYICIWNQSGLTFENISSLAHLNSRNEIFKKNYTLIKLWLSNLHFSQIEWYGKCNKILK